MKPARVTDALLRRWPLPDPEAMEGKEQRGRVLIVGGSTRIPGAVLLAATAALRVGAGKLQVATSQPVAMAVAVALPESKVSGLPVDAHGEIRRLDRDVTADAKHADAVLVGPRHRAPRHDDRRAARGLETRELVRPGERLFARRLWEDMEGRSGNIFRRLRGRSHPTEHVAGGESAEKETSRRKW